MPSTGGTLNCNVLISRENGPYRSSSASFLSLSLSRGDVHRQHAALFVSVRSPPRGHAHAARVPPHPNLNAASPREPGFAVLPCAGCGQYSPDVRDWASPLSSLDTRWHGCSLRAFALCPLLSPAVPVSASLYVHPSHRGRSSLGLTRPGWEPVSRGSGMPP